MRIQELPTEILDQIFQHLTRKEAYLCMFMCKSWFSSAARNYFKKVKLSGYTAFAFTQMMLKGNGFRYGPLVKQIHISKHFSRGIFTLLPNLEILDYSGNNNMLISHFGSMLSFVNIIDYTSIRKIELGKGPFSNEVMLRYFLVCYMIFRKSITHLKLTHLATTCNLDSSAPGPFIKSLPSFKLLTHLDLSNDKIGGDKDLHFFSVLEACPELVSFQFHSDFHISDTTANNLLSTLQHKEHHNSRLRELTLELPQITTPIMNYIISHIPTHQLDKCNLGMLNNSTANFNNWLRGDGDSKTVMRFAHYLNSVKTFRIGSLFNWSTFTSYDTSMPLQNELYAEMDRFWKFISVIKGDRKLHCCARLIMDSRTTRHFEVQVDENNQSMYLSYGFNFKGFDFSDRDAIYFPNTPSFISVLDIDIGFDESTMNVLGNVLKSFPRLFQVTALCPRGNCYFKLFSSSSITTNSYSKKHGFSSAENMTKASASSIRLSPNFTRLAHISPNLNSIKCLKSELVFDKDNNATLDLGKLELDLFDLQIINLEFRELDTVVIQFRFLNKPSFYYQSYKVQGEVNKFGKQVYRFHPTSRDFVQFNSPRTTVITIYCNSLKRFMLTDCTGNNRFVLAPAWSM